MSEVVVWLLTLPLLERCFLRCRGFATEIEQSC